LIRTISAYGVHIRDIELEKALLTGRARKALK